MRKIKFKLNSTIEDGVSHTKVEHEGELLDVLVEVIGWVCRVCYATGMSEREFTSKLKKTYKIVKTQLEKGEE